jgi:anti-sigma28 factor (negative regulator of flagellin synthesis)
MNEKLYINGADPPVRRDVRPARREVSRSVIDESGEVRSGETRGDRVTLSADSGRHVGPRQELSPADRALMLKELKQQVDNGAYSPDVNELARILTRVIDPAT